MYNVSIKDSLHEWVKQNLVTKASRRGHYDEVTCKNCGMKGRRYGFESVQVAETYNRENALLCPKAKPVEVPVQVKVIFCAAHGRQFANLTPGSIHEVVTPPAGYKNDHTGVWVMGVGEPVKLLSNEFTKVQSDV